ncbi:AMP-binding protein [Psychrobacillus vulpis]|uniref:AMP-binding protein n=1 Tax=Psychrobacillus vulpis TaxID=2325572 RepID=A0A544TWL0_9BACI|nr:AMP-binding protein [Psychrobacillus vulpis]
MVKLIQVLYKIKLLSPLGLYWFISSIYKSGVNLMLLLTMAEKTYSNKIAIVDENETISYKQLLLQCEKLSIIFKENYQVKEGQKVAFLCNNHASLVKSIFAASRLGARLYLLNTKMSNSQFNLLVDKHNFDLIIYDMELRSYIEKSKYNEANILSYHPSLPSINNLIHKKMNKNYKIPRSSMSQIVLLTGGTTGKSKEVTHKPSILNFLNPFSTLLSRLNLLSHNTAYIATPLYHGYGIAILFSFIALGKKVVIHDGFNAKKACCLIRKHNVEIITVVPLMIKKMLETSVVDLRSLVCIASGGAKLNPKLVEEVFGELGDVLYNLYGTSEAGLNIIATPQDLKYSVNTIGRVIKGVQLKILDNNKEVGNGRIGQFYIKNKWSMRNSKSHWIKTGDLGYRDHNGYYFLSGRTDDMVISAGENIYPIEVEHVLIKHPLVNDVAIIETSDDQYGQTLKAFVQPRYNENLTKEELVEWLRPKVARFQLPKDIVFVNNLPYTPLGKFDKKQLK